MIALVLAAVALLVSIAGFVLRHQTIRSIDDRLMVVEATLVDLVDESEQQPEDALARLHSEFRRKCRKAEGLEQ